MAGHAVRPGRTRDVAPFAFRVNAKQRAEIEAKATAMGLTPNQYARACALVGLTHGLGVTPDAPTQPVPTNGTSTTRGNGSARELRVEYDEVGR